MDKQTAEKITEIAKALEGIEADLRPPAPLIQPRDSSPWWPGWPWAPASNNQGFITHRWQRRNGDVYR